MGHPPKFLDSSSAPFIIVSVWRTPFSISKPRAILGALAFWGAFPSVDIAESRELSRPPRRFNFSINSLL
jgi:hypothetical protein